MPQLVGFDAALYAKHEDEILHMAAAWGYRPADVQRLADTVLFERVPSEG